MERKYATVTPPAEPITIVMHQPVDHGGGQGVVHIEGRAPVPEGSVGRDDDRAGFVPGGDDLEQQVRTSLIDRQIAKFIQQEE